MMAQRHQQEMAQQQAQLQMMQQKHAQEMAHGGHVHAQKLVHQHQAAQIQQKLAESRVAKQ